MNNLNKRNINIRHSDSPLTSKRVSIILNSEEDSGKLADAVRALRNGEEGKFTLSKKTEEILKREEEKEAIAS